MTRVYITDRVEHADIEQSILGDKNVSLEYDSNAEILMVWRLNITKDYLQQFPRLKAIIRYGVGIDRVDLAAAAERGIYVCNVPDYCTDEVADTTIAMALNFTRGISRLDKRCRDFTEKWQENSITETRRTSSLIFGAVGVGRIGANVLLKAKALKFKTAFYDPYLPLGWEHVLSAERYHTLYDILAGADIISLHLPLTNETRNLVNHEFLSHMKKGAYFINTARGKIIADIDVFYEFLQSGHIAGIALDALPFEPPQPSKLINDWKANESWLDGRITINPHNAYYSAEAAYEMRAKAAENALRILNNLKPYNIVNQHLLEKPNYA